MAIATPTSALAPIMFCSACQKIGAALEQIGRLTERSGGRGLRSQSMPSRDLLGVGAHQDTDRVLLLNDRALEARNTRDAGIIGGLRTGNRQFAVPSEFKALGEEIEGLFVGLRAVLRDLEFAIEFEQVEVAGCDVAHQR